MVLLWRKKTTQNGKGYKESLTNCLRASSRLVMNLRVRTVHALSAMVTTLLPPPQPLLLLPRPDDQRSAQRKRETFNSTAPSKNPHPQTLTLTLRALETQERRLWAVHCHIWTIWTAILQNIFWSLETPVRKRRVQVKSHKCINLLKNGFIKLKTKPVERTKSGVL
jgi:hypothetical protein